MGLWKTGGVRPRQPLEIEFEGHVYTGWVGSIFKSYRKRAAAAGRRLLPGWDDKLWRALKAKYPSYIQHVSEEKGGMARINVPTVISFAQFLVKWLSGRELATPQEANRRAAICMACPLRDRFHGCSKCREVIRHVIDPPDLEVDMGRETACLACGCYLPAKVWVPYEYLEEQRGMFPFHQSCWMLEPQGSVAAEEG